MLLANLDWITKISCKIYYDSIPSTPSNPNPTRNVNKAHQYGIIKVPTDERTNERTKRSKWNSKHSFRTADCRTVIKCSDGIIHDGWFGALLYIHTYIQHILFLQPSIEHLSVRFYFYFLFSFIFFYFARGVMSIEEKKHRAGRIRKRRNDAAL